MTESTKDFCIHLKTMCEMANAPEVYSQVVKAVSLYEDVENLSTDDGAKTVEIDWNKVPAEELDELKVDVERASEAKKAVSDATDKQNEVNTELAAKLNNSAVDAAKQDETTNG